MEIQEFRNCCLDIFPKFFSNIDYSFKFMLHKLPPKQMLALISDGSGSRALSIKSCLQEASGIKWGLIGAAFFFTDPFNWIGTRIDPRE